MGKAILYTARAGVALCVKHFTGSKSFRRMSAVLRDALAMTRRFRATEAAALINGTGCEG